jgi:CRP/FNR family transcriptional regulator, anaerobic regulatory protein
MDAGSITKIATMFEEVHITKGTFFLKANTYCNNIAFVEEGLFRVFAKTDEKEITQWIGTSGYFITDLASFYFNEQAKWNIQALSDTVVYKISKKHFQKINDTVAEWPTLEKLFIAKCFSTLENRVFSLLSMSAEQRYDLLFAQQPEIFNLVPLQYIASMLGMTAETLSRIRAKKVK